MTGIVMTRRGLLASGVGISILPMLGALPALAQDNTMRMVWWGSEDRARRTNKAIDLFEASTPGAAVEVEFMGWDDYWTRLATQVAAGNAPDLIQMDYRYLFEYAGRNAIRPLDEYMGKQLNIADFGEANLAACSVDGALYGVNLGVNAFGMVLDNAAWAEAGVEPPVYGTTWEEFAQKCADFAAANKRRNYYASADSSGQENTFEVFLLERGKTLYNDAGEIGYDADDAEAWFTLWAGIREAGGCVPPDVQALYKNTIETAPLTTGTAATDFAFSNQLAGYQKLSSKTVDMIACPVIEGGAPGHYLKPSQMLSITSSAKNPELAAELANFLARDPRGALILGIERGVPASLEIRAALADQVDEIGKKTLQFITDVEPYAGKLPPPPPKGAGENNTALIRISQEVSFGAITPEEGAKNLVAEAAANLKRG